MTGSASRWVAGLDADEVDTVRISDGNTRGNPNRVVLSESGLYALVMSSRKPEARKFRKWVTSVVLPAIRRDGSYIAGEEKVQSPEELAELQEQARRRKLDACLQGLVGAQNLRDRIRVRFPEVREPVWLLNGRPAVTEFHFLKHLGLCPRTEGKQTAWDATVCGTRMMTVGNHAPEDDNPTGIHMPRKNPGETAFGYMEDLVRAVEETWPVKGPRLLKSRQFLLASPPASNLALN